MQKLERPCLSEDALMDLNRKMIKARVGDILSLKYYSDGFIVHLTGEIRRLSFPERYVRIKNTVIKFDDMLEIY